MTNVSQVNPRPRKTQEEPHELFPPADGEDEAPEVGWILVTRHENGMTVTCPKLHKAEELPTLSALFELYGGGRYELIARTIDRRQISARRTYILAGDPKPIGGETKSAKKPLEAEVTPSLPMSQPSMPPWMAMAMPIVSMMAPVITALIQNAQQDRQQQQQMLLTLLQGQNQNSKEYVTVMQSLHNAHMESMGRLLTAKSGEPAGGIDQFQKGIEFMTEFMESQREAMSGQGEGDANEAMTKTIDQVLEGLKLIQLMPGNGSAPSSPPTT